MMRRTTRRPETLPVTITAPQIGVRRAKRDLVRLAKMSELAWVVTSHGVAKDRWAWSGIPQGLVDGLRSHGVTVDRVSADLPKVIGHFARAAARRVPGYSVKGDDAGVLVAARDARLRRQQLLREADVVVAMASTFGVRVVEHERQFYVTFEDMTVAQSPGPPSRAKDRWIERQRQIYASSDLCCAATTWAADSIHDDYGIPRSKIEVVGLGANVVCEPTAKHWSKPRLLWVGVEWYRKGGDLLLEAFRQAAIPAATLDLVGDHPNIDIPGVKGHGLVRNEIELRGLFERATLFVLPSRFEAAGIVLLEAASAGTPCVGTDIAGLPYNLGPSGMIVPVEDVNALTDALRTMTDPDVASAYGEAAVAHARRHTWGAVAGRIIQAVQDRRT